MQIVDDTIGEPNYEESSMLGKQAIYSYSESFD